MVDNTIIIPAAELVAKNKRISPNESPEYRQARNALFAEEIELRRHIEHVAALRRALPHGGGIFGEDTFDGHDGVVRISQIFGDKEIDEPTFQTGFILLLRDAIYSGRSLTLERVEAVAG